MPRRSEIKSAIEGFLGSYSSRNSDYGRYWLFGILQSEGLLTMEVNLVAQDYVSHPVIDVVSAAKALAQKKFSEQLAKQGIPRTWVASATLHLQETDETKGIVVNGRARTAVGTCFRVFVHSDLGRHFEAQRLCYVAPHSPMIEIPGHLSHSGYPDSLK